MKIRNIIAIILLSSCVIAPTQITNQPINTTSSNCETALGLIEKCSVNCSYSEGNLKIHAKTQACGVMDKIGFVNIIIQKSSDEKNWTDEKNLGDFIESDRRYYTLNHNEKVSGGFYYRIVCTHYADGLAFRNNYYATQKAENISKSVWVDYQPPEPIHTTTTTQSITTVLTTTTNVSIPAPAPAVITTCSENTTTTATDTAFKNNNQTVKSSASTIKNKTTLLSSETQTVTSSHKNSPNTGVNFPVSALLASALAVVSAIINHRKSR